MNALMVVEVAASITAGCLVVAVADGTEGRSAGERLLRLSIAILLAMGILSASYAVALFADLDRRVEPLFPIALVLVIAVFLRRRRKAVLSSSHSPRGENEARGGDCGPEEDGAPHAPGFHGDLRPSRALRALFLAAALIAGATAIEHTLREPEGGFDAWAIWNARARSLFRASSPAREAFSPALARAQFRTHPDYPLLVPGLVVEGFRLTGRESIAVPVVVALLFGVLLATLVTLGIAELLGANWGLLAGSILLSAPIFVTLVVRQCADVPLATFIFAASVLAVRADQAGSMAGTWQSRGEGRHGGLSAPQHSRHLRLIALAGFTLSFAAWCKNEGVVYLLALPLAFLLRRGIRRIELRARVAEALGWALGALPILALLFLFKLCFAPRNDLLPASGWAIVAPLFSPERWWLIVRALGRRVIALQEWGPHLLATIVVAGLLLLRRRHGIAVDPMARSIAIALALVGLAFGAVYLLTPHDVEWQIRYTFDRLAFQCWPIALLAIFLQVAGPDR